MAQPFPLINGVRFDYSSIELTLLGLRYGGVKSLSYKESKKPGKIYGTGAQVAGRTRGQYDVEGSLEMYKSDFQDFIRALTAGGRGYLEQEFNSVMNYSELFPPTIVTDVLVSCLLTDIDDSHSEGSDGLTVKADFHALYVMRDGKAPLTGIIK